MTEWFRKTTWSDADQKDFWTHHKRARAYGKAQYLRIQASHLAGTKQPELRAVALTLLNLMITEFPERTELSCALGQRAAIHETENRIDAAVTDYRSAISQERAFPNARTYAWLDFGWLVVTSSLDHLYDEALAVLNERQNDVCFPVDRFRMNAIRSIVASEREDRQQACVFAKAAIDAATQTNSGFQHHPKLGLVGEKYGSVLNRLREIQQGA